MGRIIENNQVRISGEMTSDFGFSHEVFGEGFYTAQITIRRESGQKDRILVMASERLVDVKRKWIGQSAEVSGQIRSYDRHEGERNHLELLVFASKMKIRDMGGKKIRSDENNVFLAGYVCKMPFYRRTPMGREITDLLLAVRMPYGKSVYVPCICWGRNARYAEGFEPGQPVQTRGRIQSRDYQKKISDKEYEARVAYEVSISSLQENI